MTLVAVGAIQCGYSSDMLTTIVSSDSSESGAVEQGTEIEGEVKDSDVSAAENDSESTSEVSAETNTSIPSDSDVPSDKCTDDGILPEEVLLIGDSWISLSCDRVGERARSDGVLAADEDYICRARVGASMAEILSQYDRYLNEFEDGGRVVIMNGGAVDTYGLLANKTSVGNVVDAFSAFLRQLYNAGNVTYVVYVLYADVLLPDSVDFATPMQRACNESAIQCYFVELQPLWQENPGYTSQDTINPSSAGSDAIAGAIWDVMQQNCIAQ